MTELTKPVRRLSPAAKYSRGKMRPIVVTLLPTGLQLRLHGERKAYTLPYADLYPLAVRVHQQAEKDRKREAKKQARKAK